MLIMVSNQLSESSLWDAHYVWGSMLDEWELRLYTVIPFVAC